MKKVSILSLLLIVGLVVIPTNVALAGGGTSDSGNVQVKVKVDPYIELTVEASVDLGNVSGDQGEKTFEDAMNLDVESNLGNGFVVTATSSNSHLKVGLGDPPSWGGEYSTNKRSETVNISYKMVNIRNLTAGEYDEWTVTITVNAVDLN